MPIEFQCSNCQRKLRVADDSAGRDARCPQCKSVQRVPQASSGSPPRQGEIPIGPPSGAPGATPQSGTPQSSAPAGPSGDLFAGFSAKPSSTPPPTQPTQGNPYGGSQTNPYATPAQTPPRKSTSTDSRSPLPSFDIEQTPSAFFNTAMEVITDPSGTFQRMKKTNGFWAPLLYTGIAGSISLLVGTVFHLLFTGVAIAAGGGNAEGLIIDFIRTFGMNLAFMLFGNLLGMFIAGGIYQVMLMMLGGDNHPYETTCRTVGYVVGTFSLVAAIPCVGPYISIIAQVVYMILALAETQECGGGKASAAVLIPFAVCCLAGLVIFGLMVGIIVAVANN